MLLRVDTLAYKGASSVCHSKIFKLEDGTYRMYYWSYGSRSGKDPKESIPKGLIATSTDGLHWDKPGLGQVRIDGKDTNILHIEGAEHQIVVGYSQVRIADDHWRMYFWCAENKSRLWSCMIADSEDGLHWKVINNGKGVLYHPPVPEAGVLLSEAAKKLGKDPEDYERTELRQFQANDSSTFYYSEKSGFETFHVY